MSASDMDGGTAEGTAATGWARPEMRMVALVLAIAYALGVPMIVLLEYRFGIFSERFGYPAWFVYATTLLQAACVPALLVERYVAPAAVGLSLVTVGAVASHLRIGSPVTAVPALAFTLVQLWLIRSAQRVRAGRE